MTFLLRRTIHDHLRRSQAEKILNVFQRLYLQHFLACLCGARRQAASDLAAFPSPRHERQCRTGS